MVAILDMTLARMMTCITNFNPVTILDGAPLVLTRVKSLAIHEFSGLVES